jgi:SAM-dependent methyltransferase
VQDLKTPHVSHPDPENPALAKQEKERAFHDHAYADTTRRAAFKYYAVAGESLSFYYASVRARCRGLRVLEYGSGRGASAVELAKAGARVVSIDISPVAVAMSRTRAHGEQLSTVAFCLMNAEALGFGNQTFDVITGKSVIHHLDLNCAFDEVARVLRPDGFAVFLEPMGHNPIINLYRRATPALRTADEHPLTEGDLALARRYFTRVETRYFTLFPLFGVPFRRLPGFQTLMSLLASLDRVVFKVFPFAGRFAWQVVLQLSGPRRGGTQPPALRSADRG